MELKTKQNQCDSIFNFFQTNLMDAPSDVTKPKERCPASSVVINREYPCLKRSLPIFDNKLNLNDAPTLMIITSVKTWVQAEDGPSEGPNLRVSAGEQV